MKNLEPLARQQKEIYDAMMSEQETLNRLFDEVILSPGEIYQHRKLQLVFSIIFC